MNFQMIHIACESSDNSHRKSSIFRFLQKQEHKLKKMSADDAGFYGWALTWNQSSLV